MAGFYRRGRAPAMFHFKPKFPAQKTNWPALKK
jgi:hypothetical protein